MYPFHYDILDFSWIRRRGWIIQDPGDRDFENISKEIYRSNFASCGITRWSSNRGRNTRYDLTAIIGLEEKYLVEAALCDLLDMRATVLVHYFGCHAAQLWRIDLDISFSESLLLIDSNKLLVLGVYTKDFHRTCIHRLDVFWNKGSKHVDEWFLDCQWKVASATRSNKLIEELEDAVLKQELMIDQVLAQGYHYWQIPATNLAKLGYCSSLVPWEIK